VAAQVTQAISLVLPMPVSVNAAYRNVPGVGRVKTRAYRDWATEAALLMKLQARGSIAGAYAIHVEIDRPDKRRRDLSNMLKVLEDTIVAQGLVEDDSLCDRIKMAWTDKIEGRPGPVRVWLIATGEDDDA
jgi:Holliday junction resolvase RusA-like endonuclease